MIQYYGPSIKELVEAGEFLDRQPVPDRDKETIGMIIEAHMPIDEMEEEALDKDD